ncbi:TPA: hypothetical protein N0F65_012386 [Lagenidium giganteum]|uniref:mRNA (guanine-N(7))-methyltransferase n=1 Tax=Lagenidium giganteum TaxID=4803 RepID=A0AAV2YPQ3_9STRA|nr:TPA: hypothetical protein N0F65_012386 [Lagenidium giganteum]
MQLGGNMVFEVDEEPIPSGWEVTMSRTKNMPYYHNLQTKKVYWVDDELPRGWSHQFDKDGKRFYFHIKDKNGTISYDKPVLRKASEPPISPDPVPVPAPSYSNEEDSRERRYSDHWSSTGGSPPPPILNPSTQAPPKFERKKSNSLMDLLSPGPPATGADDQQQGKSSDELGVQFDAPPLGRSSSFGSAPISNILSGNKRSFDQVTKDEDPSAAADFYNKLKRNATSERADSVLFHMRAMNNWVKSILINEFSKRDDRVLDLACGKGGDLMKWAKRGISKYVGVDIAQKSLEDAVDRFKSATQYRDLDVEFVQGDLGRVSLLNDALNCWTVDKGWHNAVPLEEPYSFNMVSMQFSFHYMFGDEERASRFFRTLHETLADGGIFIGTTVDPNKVLMKYYQSLNSPASTNGKSGDIRFLDEKNREVCTIRIDEEVRAQLAGHDAKQSGSFGMRYIFTLRDDPEETSAGQAVDLPEYLVPDDLLDRMLKENGFELLLKQNFHPFILKNIDKNRQLLEKMHVVNFEGTISDLEWECVGLYQVLAFKKAY